MADKYIIEDTGYSFLVRINKTADSLGGQVVSTHRYSETSQPKESALEGAQSDCRRLNNPDGALAIIKEIENKLFKMGKDSPNHTSTLLIQKGIKDYIIVFKLYDPLIYESHCKDSISYITAVNPVFNAPTLEEALKKWLLDKG